MSEQPPKSFNLSFINSIFSVSKAEWNLLVDNNYPFLKHEFLAALEESDSVNPVTGWQPKHLLGYINEKLVFAMPLYIKQHSYGEYVFDFQWAEACHRSGIDYYPKLLNAIPFSPITGQRYLVEKSVVELGLSQEELFSKVRAFLVEEVKSTEASSLHMLFHNKNLQLVKQAEFISRHGIQYHWKNHGYENFDSFLQACRKKYRNNIKRERNKIKQQNITISLRERESFDELLVERLYLFYQLTYVKRSGHGGYLTRDFFKLIFSELPEQIVVITAELEGELVAASFLMRDDENLYGRYWGCVKEFDYLHFELCYYS
ncbi:MAG: GNAT family N-acetyltransferase, partial [Kangiellaceae bacterium]|nr:GNAT family N-acetyltransferase [Kangiellaceae bacterium]